MRKELVNALADLRILLRHEVGGDFLVDGCPALASVLRTKSSRRGDRDVHRPVDELDRVAAHPAGARLPVLPRRVLEQRAIHLPGRTAIVGTEQDARVAPEPELGILARFDVPRRVQLEPGLLGQPELLGPLPGFAEVVRPVHRCPVEEVVGRRVKRAVARIDDRVVDGPTRKHRPFDTPAFVAVSAAEQEQTFLRPDG